MVAVQSTSSSDTLTHDTSSTHDEPRPHLYPWFPAHTPKSTLLAHPYKGSGTAESPYALEWVPSSTTSVNGKDELQILDPENPQNWSVRIKWGTVVIGALGVLSVTMASSIMSAAVFDIRREFPGYSDEMYIMITSIFVLGFIVGPFIWAPSSEVFGRRRMFIITFIPYTAFNAAVCGANSLDALLAFRFLAGVFGSSCLTSVGGIITDMFPPTSRAKALDLFSIAPFLGPAIGPVAGGFLAEAEGSSWRWVAALLALFSAILTVAGAVWMPETYEAVLLRRRAARLEKEGGKGIVWAYYRDVAKPLQPKELFLNQLKTPWKLLFTEPIAMLMALYLSVVFAILYMLFTSFPIVFVQQRGWSPAIGGLAFIGLSIGAALGLVFLGLKNRRFSSKLERAGGYLPPEERLPMVIVGGILFPVGLLMFAWTSTPSVHWIVPIIASVIFGAGLVGLFLGITSYLVDTYTIYSASALAGNIVMRSTFGVCFPLFTTKMYRNLGVQWAGTVIGLIALVFAPAPILFWKYGQRIRMSSKYAREADAVARGAAEKSRRERMVASGPDLGPTTTPDDDTTDEEKAVVPDSTSLSQVSGSTVRRTESRVSRMSEQVDAMDLSAVLGGRRE